MSLDSFAEILKSVTQQPNWETYRQYCHLVECWRSSVSPQVSCNTRPLAISRQVLWVATSSAAWAQNLSLQRYSLLKKLNPLLAEPIVEIRFSSALWHNSPPKGSVMGTVEPISKQQHPSYIREGSSVDADDASSNNDRPGTSFDRWIERIRLRVQNLPSCPRCHAPTPSGELERWNCCAVCANRPGQS
jgi:predicted nucleic acid-binding Zn ribbon protein